MWYQLYIDYKKVEYKISNIKECFKYNISAIEEKAKKDSTICMEAIRHNENYYYSKNIEALKRKVNELGWIYADYLDISISEQRALMNNLKSQIKKIEQSIESKETIRLNILKEFSNYVLDYKKLLIKNISKVHITPKGAERIKNNLKLDIPYLYDLEEYCKEFILNDNSYIYIKNNSWYITKDNIQLTINPSSYTIITAHIIR